MPAGERVDCAPLDADLDLIRECAEKAGEIAMTYFRRDPDVWYKNVDRSPVSAADIEIDRMLRADLLSARPDYGWLSEESGDETARRDRDTVFVVDPIDGTRAFVAGKTVWCVSIAVVRRGQPVAGVLVAPAMGEVFQAHREGPARKNDAPITVNAWPRETGDDTTLVMAAPRRIMAHLPQTLRARVTAAGHIPSLAYRLAMVADGRLDATVVRRDANDWDIAAADIILQRAGGVLVRASGEPVGYNGERTAHGMLLAAAHDGIPRLVEAAGTISGH